MLGAVLQHVVTVATFGAILSDAHLNAESNGEGPNLQLNDMLEKFTKNCVRAYVASKCVCLA